MFKRLQALRRYRSVLLLVGAIILGLGAALATRNYIAEQLAIERERLNPKRDEVDVVVAKRDLRRGELVGPDTMATRRIPREFVSGTAIRPERFEGYIGARLSSPLRGGEPLLNQGIDGADATSFSSKIRTGIRALTVQVDEVNSISGMLQPGDRIDLQLSVRPPARGVAGPPAELTAPLMQDVLVLATGRQVRSGNDDAGNARTFTTITVEVTPEQAQKLIVAQRGGRLTALLRNRDDRMSVAQRPIDIHDLLGLPAPAPAPVQVAARPIEVIVGGRGVLHRPAAPEQGAASAAPGLATAATALMNQISGAGTGAALASPGAISTRPAGSQTEAPEPSAPSAASAIVWPGSTPAVGSAAAAPPPPSASLPASAPSTLK